MQEADVIMEGRINDSPKLMHPGVFKLTKQNHVFTGHSVTF